MLAPALTFLDTLIHSALHQIPNDVDFRIMLTFLELYQTLLGFVLFKLYTDENLVYPPRFDEAKDAAGAGVGALALTEASAAALNGTSGADAGGGAGRTGGTRALDKDGNKVSPRDVKRQIKAISSQAGPSDLAKEDDEAATAPAAAADSELVEDVDQFVSQPSKSEAAASGSELATLSDLTAASASGADGQRLFAPYTFYISRECPRGVVEFVLRSFGATPSRVGWDEVAGAGSAVTESDERITHHIVDRPPATAGARPNHPGKRVYVQPQWIIDCANARRVLPHEPYAPGRTLPPHLSPFVDEEEVARRGGYIPAEARAQLGMDEDETAQIVEDDSSEDEDEEEAAEEEEADAAEKVERSALAALLADPADPTGALLDAAELEAEAAGGDTAKALADVRAQHAKAAKAAKKAGSAAAKGKAKGEDAEQREMARMLMSNKQKKLYNKLSYTAGKRGEEVSGVTSFLLSARSQIMGLFSLLTPSYVTFPTNRKLHWSRKKQLWTRPHGRLARRVARKELCSHLCSHYFSIPPPSVHASFTSPSRPPSWHPSLEVFLADLIREGHCVSYHFFCLTLDRGSSVFNGLHTRPQTSIVSDEP